MTSIIKVNNIQNSSGTAAVTIDGSSNVTIPQNATISGTTTATGKITSTAGITFGSDTATSNVFDDYEEGTWSPNFPNMNSGLTTGTYTKLGNLVICNFELQANGSNTNVQVSGVPFAMLVASGQRGGGLATYQNRNSTETWQVIPASSSAFSFYFGAASRTITSSETVMGTFSFFTTS